MPSTLWLLRAVESPTEHAIASTGAVLTMSQRAIPLTQSSVLPVCLRYEIHSWHAPGLHRGSPDRSGLNVPETLDDSETRARQ